MKKFFFLFLFSASFATIHAEIQVLDTIRVVIYGDDYTDLITQTETERKWLDGSTRGLDQLVSERLIFHDAEKFKIIPDTEMVDKYLESIQRDNNMSLEQLKQLFTNAGYTYDEGRTQFSVILTVNTMLDYKIRSRLAVPEREVREYFNANPAFENTSYELMYTAVPWSSGMNPDELEQYIKDILSGKKNGTLEWSEPFWVKEHEIAPEKSFILSMKPGDISNPLRTDSGFELFRLLDKKEKRELTFEERYKEIVEILRNPRYDQLFKEYERSLFSTATLLFF